MDEEMEDQRVYDLMAFRKKRQKDAAEAERLAQVEKKGLKQWERVKTAAAELVDPEDHAMKVLHSLRKDEIEMLAIAFLATVVANQDMAKDKFLEAHEAANS